MLQDITKYDLLDLLVMDALPEETQAGVVLRFSRALGGYIGQELSKYFTDADTQELQKLLQNERITPDAIIAFYKTKLPDIEQKLDDCAVQFKHMFILTVYENKVRELEGQTMQSTDTDPVAGQMLRAKKSELEQWNKVLAAANHDEWDAVATMLQTVQR